MNGFWESDTPVVFGLAELLGSLFLAAFVHLMLAFPEGRLATPVQRRLIAGLWLTALLANALPAVFNTAVNDCKGCPDNPLVIADRPGLATRLRGDLLGRRRRSSSSASSSCSCAAGAGRPRRSGGSSGRSTSPAG